MPALNKSRAIYCPSGVSSFFEICDRNPDGSKIEDPLQVGARGGGFIIKRGNTTRAFIGGSIKRDEVVINGRKAPEAKTSLRVIGLIRSRYPKIPPTKVVHVIEPPVGSGFGTSGAGAVGTALALSDLLDLRMTLAHASAFAHVGEIESVTGLGTVISLVSGSGGIGLVTEPGTYSVGRVDSIPRKYDDFTLICAWFGPIEKSSVLHNEVMRRKVNKHGRRTMKAVLDDPTPESLLRNSYRFAQDSGLASKDLLDLARKALELGAIGASQNMIGNGIHCLVSKSMRKKFLEHFRKVVPAGSIFESELSQSGPVIL